VTAVKPGRLETFTRVARESGPLWACALALDRVVPFGAVRLWSPRVVTDRALAEQVGAILEAWGMPDAERAITVEKILYADLRGIDSHGCCMFPFYQQLRDEGRLNAKATVAVVREDASTALVDGGGGLGHAPGTRAMEIAIEKSRATGVGVVAVRHSGHYGAAGAYAVMAAERGLIGLATTSTPTPAVVPTFGRKPMLGTNPIALAAPAGRNRPFLLDMATSTVSLGKLLERWRSGRALPPRWAVDAHGRPLTNGRIAAQQRRLAPLGGDREGGSHKGYGLAVVVEILSAILPGIALTDPAAGRRDEVGHFFLALDPARFREAAGFAGDLDQLLDSLRGAEPIDPRQPVLVAGDPEQATLVRRRRDGIPLTRSVFEDLRAVARAAGAPFVLGAGSP
jgi:LDH2 family malate/lactate/ureidoglycolate dehydrogenase